MPMRKAWIAARAVILMTAIGSARSSGSGSSLTWNEPGHALLLPGQIVPALADLGRYNSYGEARGYGFESIFYRVLYQAGSAIAAPEGGSTQCGLVVGHHLFTYHRSRALAAPLPDGRCQEPQGGLD